MNKRGPILRYHASPDLLGRSLERQLLDQFGEYRFRTFTDHNDFCTRLHEKLSVKFALRIEPAYCATSQAVDRQPPQGEAQADPSPIVIERSDLGQRGRAEQARGACEDRSSRKEAACLVAHHETSRCPARAPVPESSPDYS